MPALAVRHDKNDPLHRAAAVVSPESAHLTMASRRSGRKTSVGVAADRPGRGLAESVAHPPSGRQTSMPFRTAWCGTTGAVEGG